MLEFFYPEGQSSLGSESQGLMVTSRHISKADILKECSSFKLMYPISLTKLTLTLTWLMDYISKCDNVVLVVIKERAPSRNIWLFLRSKSENLLEKITRVNITKNLSVLIFVIFMQYARYYTYKESLASIN